MVLVYLLRSYPFRVASTLAVAQKQVLARPSFDTLTVQLLTPHSSFLIPLSSFLYRLIRFHCPRYLYNIF